MSFFFFMPLWMKPSASLEGSRWLSSTLIVGAEWRCNLPEWSKLFFSSHTMWLRIQTSLTCRVLVSRIAAWWDLVVCQTCIIEQSNMERASWFILQGNKTLKTLTTFCVGRAANVEEMGKGRQAQPVLSLLCQSRLFIRVSWGEMQERGRIRPRVLTEVVTVQEIIGSL